MPAVVAVGTVPDHRRRTGQSARALFSHGRETRVGESRGRLGDGVFRSAEQRMPPRTPPEEPPPRGCNTLD